MKPEVIAHSFTELQKIGKIGVGVPDGQKLDVHMMEQEGKKVQDDVGR
jgi:hypothetical protein